MTAYQKIKEAELLLDPEFYTGGIVPARAIEKYAKCLEAVEKIRARKAKFKAENPEKVKADRAKYRAENPEKEKAALAKYRAENREKINAQERARSAAKRQTA